MANVFFCADLHLGHKNIHKFRTDFESEEHHRAIIKENYHNVVNKRDTVYMLGDICFSHEALNEIKSWKGRKILICGNHDLAKGITMQDLCNTYDSVYSLLKYKEFWLSHAPIHPAELRGKYNLHGHVHFATLDDPRYFNCCLENTSYKPIDINAVRSRFNTVIGEKKYG